MRPKYNVDDLKKLFGFVFTNAGASSREVLAERNGLVRWLDNAPLVVYIDQSQENTTDESESNIKDFIENVVLRSTGDIGFFGFGEDEVFPWPDPERVGGRPFFGLVEAHARALDPEVKKLVISDLNYTKPPCAIDESWAVYYFTATQK